MRRRPSRVGMALLVSVAVAVGGCSSNSVKREDSTPSSTAATTTAATTTPTTTKPATTKPTTTKPATTKPTTVAPAPTIAIPKVTPQAQPAVDNYLAFLRAEVYVGQDPGEIRRGDLTMLLGSHALKDVNAQLDAMAAAGLAFRGIPDNPRVKVDFIASSRLIVLNSCPLASKTDPYRVVKVSTGKTVAPPKQNPPPPYELRLLMFQNKKGRWVLIDSTQDTSRTCTS